MLLTRMGCAGEGSPKPAAPPPILRALTHSIPRKATAVVSPHRDELVLLQDIQARVVRALEAIRDGERELLEAILDDVSDDLWKAIETAELARKDAA